jgi:hypothetical protein
MFFRVAIFLAGISCSLFTWSQQAEQTRPKQMHEIPVSPVHAFLFSADYASNTNVLGNFNTAVRQPSYSPSISFFSKWGVDISLLGYVVDNSDDSLENFTAELDLMLGYTFEPVKNLVIYPSYAHFMYSENSNSLKSIFSDNLQLDIDYTAKYLDVGVSTGYFTGKQHTFYAQARAFAMLSFDHVFFRKGVLSLQPGIDANFGDYEYLNLYYLDELMENTGFSNYLLLYPAIRRYVIYHKMQNPDLTMEQILDSFLREKAEDTFKFTSAGLNLPISYMIGNFSFNLGIYAFIPVNQPDYLDYGIQYFFNFGLTYMLVFE